MNKICAPSQLVCTNLCLLIMTPPLREFLFLNQLGSFVNHFEPNGVILNSYPDSLQVDNQMY